MSYIVSASASSTPQWPKSWFTFNELEISHLWVDRDMQHQSGEWGIKQTNWNNECMLCYKSISWSFKNPPPKKRKIEHNFMLIFEASTYFTCCIHRNGYCSIWAHQCIEQYFIHMAWCFHKFFSIKLPWYNQTFKHIFIIVWKLETFFHT